MISGALPPAAWAPPGCERTGLPVREFGRGTGSGFTPGFRFPVFSDAPVPGDVTIASAPAPPSGGQGWRKGGGIIPLQEFHEDLWDASAHASAGTESAQVSTFVRIASSEYEVRFTRSRAIVTM